jgi:membrane-associated phospholipid phosphatase
MRQFIIFLLSITPCLACSAQSSFGRFGDAGRYLLPVTAALIAAQHHDTDGLRQFALSFGASLAATQLLKSTVNERRPNGTSNNSFPSGHSAWAFSPATFLAKRYGPEYGVPALLLAGLVGISRVSTRHHYAHDVIAGALLASSMTMLFTSGYQNDNLNVGFTVKKLHKSTAYVVSLDMHLD